MTAAEGRGRRIETPTQFAGDTGEVDADLGRALATDDADGVLAALCAGARLLVPIVAVLDERGEDGQDKSSHMASVSIVQPDGRRGLVAFTCLSALQAWNPDARPVPARAGDVARAAREEGADGVLVDCAGPVRFVLEGPALAAVAASP